MERISFKADICVVGGGLSGICAAIAAARLGSRVAVMHDRPMFGGNASSEVRMWVCGAHGPNNRETGLAEELELENFRINPMRNYGIWDGVLYEKVMAEGNATAFLNCACCMADMRGRGPGGRAVKSVTGYQTTTQRWVDVEAEIFIDCSGDSVLAGLTGADHRIGREGRLEHGESIAPDEPDGLTMGMSCLLQFRRTGRRSIYTPPARAYKYKSSDLPHRVPAKSIVDENFWYIELGGMGGGAGCTERTRDELLRVAWGVADYVKNGGDYDADHWELDWVGFLPGKRESLRYVGDHTLTQGDVESGGAFDDIVAYGGWTMDDHHPGGFLHGGPPTIFHPAPSPYGIPYRCLYSANVPNLMFAGRNISATHSALSSTRVMATCMGLGQASGTAAHMAVRSGVTPRGVYQSGDLLGGLQQSLMDQDCFLPYLRRRVSDLTASATLDPRYEPLRNGFDRPIPLAAMSGLVRGNTQGASGGARAHAGGTPTSSKPAFAENGVTLRLGERVEFMYGEPRTVRGMRLVFDSDLDRATVRPINPMNEMRAALTHNMMSNRPLDFDGILFPETMVSDFLVEAVRDSGREVLAKVEGNRMRLVRLGFGEPAEKVRGLAFTPLKTTGREPWRAENARVFSVDIL
ncbi:MAG: FAD-dependent oxidoreductase [Oscillospiraceae bacterium]|nr:FAD-dependent oxidoreductase [Oscillospiraceae bacterium]